MSHTQNKQTNKRQARKNKTKLLYCWLRASPLNPNVWSQLNSTLWTHEGLPCVCFPLTHIQTGGAAPISVGCQGTARNPEAMVHYKTSQNRSWTHERKLHKLCSSYSIAFSITTDTCYMSDHVRSFHSTLYPKIQRLWYLCCSVFFSHCIFPLALSLSEL